MNIGLLDVTLSVSAAGTTQATATLLIGGLSTVTTVASGSGVVLSPNVTSALQMVFNGGANPLTVYPPVGYKINNLAANGGHILGINTACQYWTVSSTQVVGFLSA